MHGQLKKFTALETLHPRLTLVDGWGTNDGYAMSGIGFATNCSCVCNKQTATVKEEDVASI